MHQTLVLLHKCPSVLVLKNSPAFESNQLAVDGANRRVILWPRPNQKYGVDMLHPLKSDLCTHISRLRRKKPEVYHPTDIKESTQAQLQLIRA